MQANEKNTDSLKANNKFCIHFEGTIGENGIESLDVRKLEGEKLSLTAGVFAIVADLSPKISVSEEKLLDIMYEVINLAKKV